MLCATRPRRELLALLLLFSASFLFAEEKSAEQRLAAIDRVRLPPRSFIVDLNIADYRMGKKEREAGFRLYSKRKVGGGFDSLAVCLTPPPDRNKLLLAKGDQLWFYDPRSARPVPVAPSQFRSHAFVLDLLAGPLAATYRVESEGEATTTDLGRHEISAERLRLTHRAQNKGGSVLRYWVDKNNDRAFKSEIVGANQKILRTVYYSDFRPALGEQRPMRAVVVNPIENNVIELKFSSFSYHDTPEEVFDESQLPVVLSRLK